jgi:hypothetical protein
MMVGAAPAACGARALRQGEHVQGDHPGERAAPAAYAADGRASTHRPQGRGERPGELSRSDTFCLSPSPLLEMAAFPFSHLHCSQDAHMVLPVQIAKPCWIQPKAPFGSHK